MKYQSELIKEIVESRGHEKSSIHYESECVESWVEETKGAYPKLCDYQSEWLNYINENPIGNFPYVTVTDVTETTVNNVVPYAYKRAILRGQTLVNLIQPKTLTFATGNTPNYTNIVNTPNYISVETIANLDTWSIITCDVQLPMLKPNTKYLVKFDELKGHELYVSIRKKNGENILTKEQIVDTSRTYVILTTESTLNIDSQVLYINIPSSTPVGTKIVVSKPRIIEYQKGMENWDIPYFEGMQSVQMPVLTTTGKNLFDGIFIHGDIANGVDNNQTQYVKSANYFSIEPNTNYYLTCNDGYNSTNAKIIAWYDSNKNFITHKNGGGVSPSNACFARIRTRKDDSTTITQDELSNIQAQLEEGSTTTTYEPYKSIILTTPQDLELRGIGDVQDEMDCLTGEVVKRTNQIIIDGKNIVCTSGNNTDEMVTFMGRVRFSNYNLPESLKETTVLCDKFPSITTSSWRTDYEQVTIADIRYVDVRINKSKLSDISINGLNQYLQSNPITIVYPIEESIKTVDLNIQDQDGNTLRKIKPIEGTMHIHSDGTPLKPSITMEIPVEATTQNLASFTKEE